MTLYKYIRYRDRYFENPTLRITQRNALNDPFEVLPPKAELLAAYKDFFDISVENVTSSAMMKEIDLYLNVANDDSIYKFSDPMNNYGIVSFCPAFDSLTMWSHYADEHKGIVIELDSEKLGLVNRISLSTESDNISKPQSVFYSKTRKAPKKNDIFLESLNAYFLIKSEEWINENEIRIVAKLTDATQVIVKRTDWLELSQENPNMTASFSITDINDGMIIINKIADFKNIFNVSSSFPNSSLEQQNIALEYCYSRLASYSNTLFLYSIPDSSITRIFCGCNMVIEKIVEVNQMTKRLFLQPEICRMERDKEDFRIRI
jgi:hypothetical protein